jgi:hypothetical protein
MYKETKIGPEVNTTIQDLIQFYAFNILIILILQL